jgi:STE24 endopeptidase
MIDIFLFFVVGLYILLKIALDIHQIQYIKTTKISNDELDLFSIDSNYIKKSISYNTDKLSASIVNTLISGMIIIYFVFFGGVDDLSKLMSGLNLFQLNDDLLIIIAFIIIMSLVNIPLDIYKTFYIEEKHGFNKNNINQYLKDTFISLILTLLIVFVLFSIFHGLFQEYPESWWLYMWFAYISFNVIVLFAYPTIIAPMFNDFKKLSDKKIINIIKTLSDKTKFNITDVYVMDGSKRSKHSNAYFTGFYKSKRIVFFDTLLEILTPNEVQAVLAHEIGHYKKNHITKSIILSLFLSLAGLYILFQLSTYAPLFIELGINPYSTSQLVIFFSLVLSPILYFVSPVFSSISRKNEFEADNYAKEHSDKSYLISSLKKLYRENLTLIKTSPIYSQIYNSHPTVFERINNLKL